LWLTEGLCQIFILLPVATAKKRESGENVNAVTVSLKLKWAIITYFKLFIIKAKPSTSIVIKILLSGDIITLSMLLRF
jgi:hypothetical protein